MSAALANALYNAVLFGIGILGLPLWIVWVLTSRRLRAGFGERLRPLRVSEEPTFWVHAASVGEVEAAVPLIRALRERGIALRLTAQSDTGRERLRSRVPELAPRLAPLDLPWLARASARRARVRALLLVETELWPNTIRAVRAAGGVVLVVSGRISDRSYPRYRTIRPLLQGLLASIDGVAARSESDRKRFVELGAHPDRVRVLGDVKRARAAPVASEPLRAAIGGGPVLLGGSTHPGEEGALLGAYTDLCRSVPDLRLVLAPRYPERAAEIVASVRERGLSVGRRSEGAAGRRVVVVDTLGELASLYGLADLVFCGGTLVPVGGHNLFEPVAAGRVVVVGPHTHNQRAQVEALERDGALVRIEAAEDLSRVLKKLWQSPDRDLAARKVWSRLGGEDRTLKPILEWLEALGALDRAG